MSKELAALAAEIGRVALERLPEGEKPTEAIRALLWSLIRVCRAVDRVASQRNPLNEPITKELLACTLVAHWAGRTDLNVRGALLVAPPNPDGPDFPKEAVGFTPLPLNRLLFPSIDVASADDPYADLEFSERVALAWGSRLVNIGASGHINSRSGLGDWNECLSLLRQLAT